MVNEHYNDQYFKFQQSSGAFSGKAMNPFFQPFIKSSDNVLDFGCGGGFILQGLECKSRFGIEINPAAREVAEKNGVKTFADIDEVEDDWADVLISCHALEHTTNPYEIICSLRTKLKRGGKVVFIVPHETHNKYVPNDVNQHLYTWSEMCIGNLFSAAGYEVLESKELLYRYPPGYKKLQRKYGWKIFNVLAKLYARYASLRYMTQVRLIAERTIS